MKLSSVVVCTHHAMDNGLLYTPIIVPDILKDCLLILAHEKQGHNRFRRTYASLRNRYHWKGMKKSVYQQCSRCQVCAKHNIKTQQLKNEHFSSPPQPMEFIAVDLIGEFHPASSKGNRYALTAVCMLHILYTGRERLIRSHSSARFCFELSGNSN